MSPPLIQPTVPWCPALKSPIPGPVLGLMQEICLYVGENPGVGAVQVIDEVESAGCLEWDEAAAVLQLMMELLMLDFALINPAGQA